MPVNEELQSVILSNENTEFTRKEYAAMLLKVPSSGTPWLDAMIESARTLDKADKLEVKRAAWNPSILEGRKVSSIKYSDPKYPTNSEWMMFDPEVQPPPKGVTLLVLSEGGVLLKHPWYEGAIAWAYLPAVPQSVKDRNGKRNSESN